MRLSPEMAAKVLELAGESGAKSRQSRLPSPVATPSLGLTSATLCLGCRVVSEANQRCHWSVRHKRFKGQREHLLSALMSIGWFDVGNKCHWPFVLPATVTFTHLGSQMDDDNLSGAFKGLRDVVAEWAGVDDADPRIVWKYEQRKATPASVEIRIESLGGRS